MPAMGEMR